jgi:hypothetical protein
MQTDTQWTVLTIGSAYWAQVSAAGITLQLRSVTREIELLGSSFTRVI